MQFFSPMKSCFNAISTIHLVAVKRLDKSTIIKHVSPLSKCQWLDDSRKRQMGGAEFPPPGQYLTRERSLHASS